ncbi:MAG: response regulator, partial [Okeania sp. SIO2H7]|nr:response regulator [Okeania sp. SIO2H7]
MNVNPSCEPNTDILIVDDNPYNLRLLSMILTDHGYEVRKAVSGKMALQSVKVMPPDLILLDIKMPGMDGYEICETLKNDPTFQYIPIIFISALDDVVDKVKAFSVGCVDYITKPFHQEEVLARVENQIRIQVLNSELEKKNKDLQELNEKLAASNQRLNEFAHVVSHDLKQPIQGIMGFSNLI